MALCVEVRGLVDIGADFSSIPDWYSEEFGSMPHAYLKEFLTVLVAPAVRSRAQRSVKHMSRGYRSKTRLGS